MEIAIFKSLIWRCNEMAYQLHWNITMKLWLTLNILTLSLLAASAHAGGNRYCAGNVTDSEGVPSDQSLEYVINQPASIGVCMAAYELEKCGDVESANLVYDKCIQAGYSGAIIRKAHMLENGVGGNPPDPVAATELMRRVAVSGHSGYATLGKLHYASALLLGKGVPPNEAEAHRWFTAAAQEGDPDAANYLRTGHHTGELDAQGHGVGPLP